MNIIKIKDFSKNTRLVLMAVLRDSLGRPSFNLEEDEIGTHDIDVAEEVSRGG